MHNALYSDTDEAAAPLRVTSFAMSLHPKRTCSNCKIDFVYTCPTVCMYNVMYKLMNGTVTLLSGNNH